MYVRNLLRAGEYVELVPLGLPITIVYNQHIDRIYVNFDESNHIDVTDQFLTLFKKHNIAPLKIGIVTGTTWVKGVLYTNKRVYNEGDLPDSHVSQLIDLFIKSPNAFNFFAGHVSSLGTVLKGAFAIRQWLTRSNFKTLPGFIVPSNIDKNQFYRIVNQMNLTFQFPLYMYYIIYSNDSVQIQSTGLKQYFVKSLNTDIDSHGNLVTEIETNTRCIRKSYSDIVFNQLNLTSYFITDIYGDIIFTSNNDTSKRISSTVTCKYCGKPFTVEKSEVTMCSNSHCPSHIYSKLSQVLDTYNLDSIPFDKFKCLIDTNEIITFVDTIDLIRSNCKITSNLCTFLRAMVPVEVVPSKDLLEKFCNNCNHTWESIEYYIKNPQYILNDNLLPDSIQLRRFIDYLSDYQNVQDILIFYQSNLFEFDTLIRKFDGPPIFRGKTIYILGKFKHGDYLEITSILQSYGAKVIYTFDDTVNLALVGDIKENINGGSLRNCKYLHIPIMSESDFFDTYDIDTDLNSNLS